MPLNLIQKAADIVDEQINGGGFAFNGVMTYEDEDPLLEFVFEEGVQYRPYYLIDPKDLSIKYYSESESSSDETPF